MMSGCGRRCKQIGACKLSLLDAGTLETFTSPAEYWTWWTWDYLTAILTEIETRTSLLSSTRASTKSLLSETKALDGEVDYYVVQMVSVCHWEILFWARSSEQKKIYIILMPRESGQTMQFYPPQQYWSITVEAPKPCIENLREFFLFLPDSYESWLDLSLVFPRPVNSCSLRPNILKWEDARFHAPASTDCQTLMVGDLFQWRQNVQKKKKTSQDKTRNRKRVSCRGLHRKRPEREREKFT